MLRQSLSSRKGWRGTMVAVLMLCSCLASLWLYCTVKEQPDEPGPGDIADDLVEALVAADLEGAKMLTMPEQWDRIEGWMEGRQPFRCRGGAWDATGVSGSGGPASVDIGWRWSLTYQCASERTPYCLLVTDILTQETEEGWRVFGWGSIYEAFDYGHKCQEMHYLQDAP